MELGIFSSAWLSAFEVWVAIQLSYRTSFIQNVQQGLPDVLRGHPAILAHPRQCGPVPGSEQGKKDESNQPDFPICRNKSIEVRQLVRVSVADPFYAIKRNAAHLGQAGDSGGFHIHQAGSV